MIDFLVTPIGVWSALMALVVAVILVGAAMVAFADSLRGEEIVARSLVAAGIITVAGLLPALYLSGFGQVALMILIAAGTLALALGLLALILSPQHGRGFPS